MTDADWVRYAQLNWRLLPVKKLAKKPILLDWVNQASCDTGVIAEWCNEYPGCNFGVATGEASGFFVLDVDPSKGGLEALAALEAEHGDLPHGPEQQTGSGGYHYLFQLPDFPVTNSVERLGKGLDIRGNGGQIVISPSVTEKGPYQWVTAPWDAPAPPAPEWILSKLRPRADLARPITDYTPHVFPVATAEVLEEARAALEAHGPAIEGQGGDQHTHVAARIVGNDFALSEAEAWPLLLGWNETCQPPWSESALRAKLQGGMRDGAIKPYGNRREVDPLASIRALIEAHRADPAGDTDCLKLLESCRTLEFHDPAARQRAEIELKSYTQLSVRSIALPKARPPPRDPSDVLSGWHGFDLTAGGQPVTNLHNVVTILERAEAPIGVDTFLQRVVMVTPEQEIREWSDDDDFKLTFRIQKEHKITNMPVQTVNHGVTTYALKRTMNCALNMIKSEKWDGRPRLSGFFRLAFGAEDNEYTRCAGRNFIMGMVARVLRPGCKVDTMPILEGVQGLFKSTALKELVGERFFAEASESPTSKDFFQALTGKMLVEVGEMDAFSRHDVAAVKRVLSCAVDRYRAPYERRSRDWPRQGVFAGTTNSSDWHKDESGARRFWPILCHLIDLELIRRDRLQLFAEALEYVEAGMPWWEMPKELTEAAQEARRQEHPWEAILADYLEGKSEVTITEALLIGLEKQVGQLTKGDQMTCGLVLRRLGFQRVDGRVGGEKKKFWERQG